MPAHTCSEEVCIVCIEQNEYPSVSGVYRIMPNDRTGCRGKERPNLGTDIKQTVQKLLMGPPSIRDKQFHSKLLWLMAGPPHLHFFGLFHYTRTHPPVAYYSLATEENPHSPLLVSAK